MNKIITEQDMILFSDVLPEDVLVDIYKSLPDAPDETIDKKRASEICYDIKRLVKLLEDVVK